MPKISQSITVTTQFVGLHHWPEAPSHVGFLRYPHRHCFGVEVEIATSSSREVEFFTAKRMVDAAVADLRKDLIKNPSYSCEQMAEYIGLRIERIYEVKSVQVDEDAENGATVFFAPRAAQKQIEEGRASANTNGVGRGTNTENPPPEDKPASAPVA